MKFSNFMNSLLTNLIAPEIKLAKTSGLKFMFKKPYLSQYLMDSDKWAQILSWSVEVKYREIHYNIG